MFETFGKHLYLMKTNCCMNAKFYKIELWKELNFEFFCIVCKFVKSIVGEWCDIIIIH
jgi:hypothetical protein